MRDDEQDDDAVFAELVAAFDEPVDLTAHHWPAAEDVPPGAETPTLPPVTDLPDLTDFVEFAPKPRPRSGPALGPRDWEFDDEEADEEHFTPPEPPAGPAVDSFTRLAWAAVVGGPVLILVLALTGQSVGGLWALVSAAMFLGGSVALVTRLKSDPEDDDDDPQRGAVV
jgi:hypothetical protein